MIALGEGSTSVVPPLDYWRRLATTTPGAQLEEFQRLSDERLNEFSPSDLPPPQHTATTLLDRVAADGWLERIERCRCPNCNCELAADQPAHEACQECGEPYVNHGGVKTETVYVRSLAPIRVVDWVVAIHGMNTAGAWQEEFSWYLATTWGRSVPVAVYKYGIVVSGVLMAWRRQKLRHDLRDKLASLADKARTQGFSGKPDLIAHSFGTWLIGHILEHELTRRPEERLCFGRVILTGCVLRPDFDWKTLRDEALVEEVLNHYGTEDLVVPLAHATIGNSGPSGRRGFDGSQVFNVRAEGYGHSDLFSVDRCVTNGASFQECTGAHDGVSHLEYSYKRYWRPFLTLPPHELYRIPDRTDPLAMWRPLPWLLRGTIFPFAALPLVLALTLLSLARIGATLWDARHVAMTIGLVSAAGLSFIVSGLILTWLWRRLRS